MSNYGTMEKGPFTVTTGGALSANTLVTLNSSGLAVACGAAGAAIGWVDQGWGSGVSATILPLTGLILLVNTGGITAGDFVKPGASGAVVPEATVTTLTVNTIGQAAETALTTELVHVYCF